MLLFAPQQAVGLFILTVLCCDQGPHMTVAAMSTHQTVNLPGLGSDRVLELPSRGKANSELVCTHF